ncbi:uncharacterized protein [Lolium perenne]|uniref:uncharacterized protein n=1 Tax=Lolium perenne TaxID=4522 RepID=UPI003A994EE8
MPPRRRPSSGYHGVRARPSGRFDAEIRSGEERIRLGTFDTAHEAARAYDAVAWRLGRSRRSLNFHDVYTREQAEMLAPPPPVITQEQTRRRRELEQRLLIAERDEAMRVEWARRFPEDLAATEAFYAQKEEEKAAARRPPLESMRSFAGSNAVDQREQRGSPPKQRRLPLGAMICVPSLGAAALADGSNPSRRWDQRCPLLGALWPSSDSCGAR